MTTTAEQYINQAETSVDQKLYVKASSEYIKALKEDRATIEPLLKSKYQEAVDLHQFLSALATGIALLTIDHDNSAFANELGNLARVVGNKEQAYGLYKHALKADPKNKLPLFNIGSLSAHSQRYDREAISAYNYFSNKLNYVIPDYFIRDDNGTYLCAPDYEEDIEKDVLSFRKFRQRENEETEKDIETKTPEDKKEGAPTAKPKVALNAEDYLEFFDKTAISDEHTVYLTLYNKVIYCMKHGLYNKVLPLLPKIDPDFGYPGKYVKLIEAILLMRNNKKNALVEDLLNELVGSEPYNRYFIVNMGLFLRKINRTLHAIKYLVLGYELLNASNFKYELRHYLVELHEKVSVSGPRVAKLPLTVLYNQGVIDPLLFYNLGLSKTNEKLFIEACVLFRKTAECDDPYLAEQAKNQVDKTYDYLYKEGENQLKTNKFKTANELFYTAYQIKKDIPIIKKILQVFELYNPDPSEQEIRKTLKQELIELEKDIYSKKNAEKDKIREANLSKSRENYLRIAGENISQKKFYSAIPLLESAFRIKPDKETFIKLASIYRGLKKNEDLFHLANRYKKIIEHQEKVKKFEKETSINVS